MKVRRSLVEGARRAENLGQRLYELFGSPKKSTKPSGKRPPSTVDVLSRELCDDAIRYLAPSLEAYKGCTIIDIHPGACEWSASLHDYLKPKRHVLMEPEEAYFEPFIKPLLDKPGSTYRHTTLTGAHPSWYWSNHKKIMEDGELMEPRPALPVGDPKLRQIDTSILVTGNLVRRYKNTTRLPNQVPFAPLVLQHFTWAALTNRLFHQAGLARMLLWLPDVFKERVHTPLITTRSGFHLSVHMGAELNEIAGVRQVYDASVGRRSRYYQRPNSLVKASNLAVRQRMEHDDLKVPSRRQLLTYEPKTPPGGKSKNFLDVPNETLRTFQKACEDFDARMTGIIKTYADHGQGKRLTQMVNEYVSTIEYPQCLEFRMPAFPSVKTWRIVLLLDLNLRLINLEARFCALREKGIDVAFLYDRLIADNERLREYVRWTRKKAIMWIDDQSDDQQGYFTETQVIPWDRRRFEPLRAKATDFSRDFPLALFDVMPVLRQGLEVPGIATADEVTTVCQQLSKYIYHHRAQTLATVLDLIAPNAAKDLIPMISDLSDPRKGGRLDPRRVRVRMLSEDTIIALAKAWVEWPFRPTRWQLEQATHFSSATEEDSGAAADDEGEETEEEEECMDEYVDD